jgi:glycosyltransferase involved in cell wall biosynthesis
MRVLVLADEWSELSGGEIVPAQLARSLRERYELAVLTTDRRRTSKEQTNGLPIYRVKSSYPARIRPLVGLMNPLALSGVRRALEDFKPDLVHAWNIHGHLSYASLALARRRGVPTVLTFQDALPFCYTKYHCYIERGSPCPPRPDYRAQPGTCPSCWRHYWLFPFRNRIARELIKCYVTRKVSVSQALAHALADNGLADVQVIHNGLPLEGFPPGADEIAALRRRFELGDELIVGGGRMSFFKGQQQLLEAFARSAAERPASQLVLAGRHDDWFGAHLKKRVSELGVERRVIFTGFLPRREFIALLGASVLFASLSLYLDPFPTVNLEAGAAGRPVLGTCFGGTPEVVLGGETGDIVNPYRLSEVVEALIVLLVDRDRRADYGCRAQERIRTVFSMSAMAEAYSTLYEAVGSGSATSSSGPTASPTPCL